MPDTRYSYNVDLEHPTTSHSLAVLLVTPGSTVLDIGAADGSVARPLTARGCRVWAVEADADAAARARSACEAVIVGDVEVLDLEAALEGRRFDVVLLLDVLEHLREPLATLKRACALLATGGRIIASIPNVTHGAVRVSLMSGAFSYTETGILDRTHLRFFDRRSAEAMFGDAGLRIVERLRVTRGLNETEIPIDPAAVPPEILQMLKNDPDATTYQFMLVGVPSQGTHIPDGVSLAERLQRQTTTLKEDLQRVRAELQSELAARMRELDQGHLELRHLCADLAVKEAYIAELRQAADSAQSELAELRAFADSAAARIAAKAVAWSRRYPRLHRWLRPVARLVGGSTPDSRPS